MPNVITQTMKDKYLASLAEDERVIKEAGGAYETAKAALDVGLRRYVALRDFVEEQLGQSPYAPGVVWPYQDSNGREGRGHFRFSGKSAGDAVLEVLREHLESYRRYPTINKRWMTLGEITEALSDGGLGFPEPVIGRAVNAALQNRERAGIRRNKVRATDETVYLYDPESASDGVVTRVRQMTDEEAAVIREEKKEEA